MWWAHCTRRDGAFDPWFGRRSPYIRSLGIFTSRDTEPATGEGHVHRGVPVDSPNIAVVRQNVSIYWNDLFRASNRFWLVSLDPLIQAGVICLSAFGAASIALLLPHALPD